MFGGSSDHDLFMPLMLSYGARNGWCCSTHSAAEVCRGQETSGKTSGNGNFFISTFKGRVPVPNARAILRHKGGGGLVTSLHHASNTCTPPPPPPLVLEPHHFYTSILDPLDVRSYGGQPTSPGGGGGISQSPHNEKRRVSALLQSRRVSRQINNNSTPLE